MEHRSNSNIIFRTSHDLKRVHLLVIELEHPIFGFERMNIEPNRAFTRFTKLLIELTRTLFFLTLYELERVHLMVIELKHSIFGFKQTNIEPNRAFTRFTK